jgi:hypothetical protein
MELVQITQVAIYILVTFICFFLSGNIFVYTFYQILVICGLLCTRPRLITHKQMFSQDACNFQQMACRGSVTSQRISLPFAHEKLF